MTTYLAQHTHLPAQPWCVASLPASLEAKGLAIGGCGQTSMNANFKAIFVGGSRISADRSDRPPGALT